MQIVYKNTVEMLDEIKNIMTETWIQLLNNVTT